MNRRYEQFQWGLEKKVVSLYLRAAIGASGAPTINVAKSKGVASIARSSAGKYLITLQDRYVDLFSAEQTVQLASGSPGAFSMVVRAQDVVGAKTVTIEFLDSTGTAADLASGTTLTLKLELKASSV